MTYLSIKLLFLFIALSICQQTPLSRISFGSCNKHTHPQNYWTTISATKPDLWIWLGDVVYADEQVFPLVWRPTLEHQMRAKYDSQKRNEFYSSFANKTPVIGIWDDHDYGKNDGGAEFEGKGYAKNIFLDFIGVSGDDPVHGHEGIYSSYTYGPKGKKVKVILLDVRTFRNKEDILGEAQWKWLEEELRTSDAQINLIGSGSQVIPSDKPLIEKWENFPKSIERFYQTIAMYKTPGVILLSGDVHYGEILRSNCSKLPYPLYEFTSSGLTHSLTGQVPIVGDWVLHNMFHTQFRRGAYPGENFGNIIIDWDAKPVTVTLNLHSITGQIVSQETINLDSLKADSQNEMNPKDCVINYGYQNWRAITRTQAKMIVLAVGGIVLILTFICFRTCVNLIFYRKTVKVDNKKKKQ